METQRPRRHRYAANPRRSSDAGARAEVAPSSVEELLARALDFFTAGLDTPMATQLRATASRSPAWAARYGYALGYLEGGNDRQALLAADLAQLARTIAALRTRLARTTVGVTAPPLGSIAPAPREERDQ